MPTTLTGPYQAVRLLKYHVAASATFQALVGVGNLIDALPFAGLHEVDDADLSIPRALIQRGTHRRTPVAALGFGTEADFTINFELPIPVSAGALDFEDEGNYFMNKIGLVMKEIEDLVDTTGDVGGLNPLRIQRHWIIDGPDKLTDTERALVDASPEPNLSAWFVSIGVQL